MLCAQSADEQTGWSAGDGNNALSPVDPFFFWSSCSRVLQRHDVCRTVMLTTQHLADGS